MTDDPHKPLRDDVRMLGELLGLTLRSQEGVELFDRVERVRALAKRAREVRTRRVRGALVGAGADAGRGRLARRTGVPHFLNLANIAEQHHRIRRRRAYQRDPGAPPQRGSCEDAFERLVAAGISRQGPYEAVCALRIELVLTRAERATEGRSCFSSSSRGRS
jgi:phosphoenolpyruvate carboxylase